LIVRQKACTLIRYGEQTKGIDSMNPTGKRNFTVEMCLSVRKKLNNNEVSTGKEYLNHDLTNEEGSHEMESTDYESYRCG